MSGFHFPAVTWVGVVAAATLLGILAGVEAAPPALDPLGLQVIGPRELLVGSTAAVRVIVTDHAHGTPAAGAHVRLWLGAPGFEGRILYEGDADTLGTLHARFVVPDLAPGTAKLAVAAEWGGLTERTAQDLTLRSATQILLTTDKPIYQPSQVMHLRALALKRPTLHAAAGQEVTLEVCDARGNKVFKQAAKTSRFGIISADFQLADEVNMGSYEVRAVIGADEAKKTVTVKRYVLPKFRVTVTPDKGFYLPGERAEGKLQADYFFGKPVSGGKVVITVKTFDVEFTEIQKIQGETDDGGAFRFACKLPDRFVGQPLEQGKAFLQFEAKVTDRAQHSEQTVATSTVAPSPLTINAVPEAGKLVPGFINIIYVLTALPTGQPVQSTVRVESASCGGVALRVVRGDLRTDSGGIAEVELAVPAVLRPGGPSAPARPAGPVPLGRWGPRPQAPAPTVTLNLAARLRDGTVARKAVELSTAPGGTDSLLLRLDKPLARVGDVVTATALCSGGGGAVYFDVVKDRQTMLTAAADIRGGKATTALRFTHELSGTVLVSAYRIMPDGQIVRDTRPMFVEPADELRISVSADAETYKPGGQARLAFAVADQAGNPVAAALGINVVDESVFALQDLQPGMEKVFFYLEQELMKPRFEIHSFELPRLITEKPSRRESDATRERAARLVFANLQVPDPPAFQVDTYAARLAEAKSKWLEQMRPIVSKVHDAIEAYRQRNQHYPPYENGVAALINDGFLARADLVDLWGREVRVKPATHDADTMYSALVISAGPDGKFGTMDDIIMVTFNMGRWFLTEEEAAVPPRPPMVFALAAPAMPAGMAAAAGGARTGLAVRAPAPLLLDAAAPGAAAAAKPSVRVREYFPETLFVEPSLITDDRGKATLTIPMADSITTWRLAALANSPVGQLGSTTQGLRCFQDFFVDIDLPVSLTQNDQVSIPVAVYNYLPTEQTVRLELARDDWFGLKGEAEQTLKIAANEVDVRYFTLKVNKIGDHPLTVHAYGSRLNDAIKRRIEVMPDGKLTETTANGRLKGTVEQAIALPPEAIADASNILVKVYPGIFSQVVEGLDSILRMPFGCFEQTSSATWPNIMVLDYMRSTRQITPESQMKAEGFINTGYQRMVSYEVPGGGFSWFGTAPANKLLTAYGLMEFYDMSAVHDVDQAIITRTQQWLLGQADANGIYQPDKEYLHQETWGQVQVNELLPTAYVVWGLTHTSCKDPRVEKSAAYVRRNWRKAAEPYSLSIVCNALVGADAVFRNGDLDDSTRQALDALLKMAKTDKDQMWWAAGISGVTNSTGQCADIEATGMACIALIRSGLYGAEVSKVLNYLIAAKDPNGTWHSTNGTMLALRALTMAQRNAATKVNGEVTVTVNGRQVSGFALTPQDADVVRVIDCKQVVKPGENTVRLQFSGEGSALYQIVGRSYLPWKGLQKPQVEPLAISVKYDKTTLGKDDTVTANVTVTNNTPAALGMVLVDLGVPPGFSVNDGDFAELVGSKKIGRYTITGRQVTVYIERMDPRQTLELSYHLRAKYPIKAKTPGSVAYEYYNPDNHAEAAPVEMQVN